MTSQRRSTKAKRLRCRLRGAWARVAHGTRWDGHCWGAGPNAVLYCIDCGQVEAGFDALLAPYAEPHADSA